MVDIVEKQAEKKNKKRNTADERTQIVQHFMESSENGSNVLHPNRWANTMESKRGTPSDIWARCGVRSPSDWTI